MALLSSSAMGKEFEGWGCSMRWARGVRENTALALTSCLCQLCTQVSLVAKSCLTLGDPMDFQATLSMGLPQQEYWGGLPLPPRGDLSNPGIKPTPLTSPAWTDRFLTTSATWKTIG